MRGESENLDHYLLYWVDGGKIDNAIKQCGNINEPGQRLLATFYSESLVVTSKVVPIRVDG